MKDYANNKAMCRRDVLFSHFDRYYRSYIRDLYAYVVMCVRNHVHAPSVLVIIALAR